MINRKNVLLLQAPLPGAHNRAVAKSSAIPPLGIGYLASVLLYDGFNVQIFDMDVENIGVIELQNILVSFRPGVVGISTTTLTFKNALRVAKTVKNNLADCLVILGGPHVSVNHSDALQYPFVDIVVRGEGEMTFLEICRSIEKGDFPDNIQGTIVRSNDSIIVLPKRERIANLDALPFPARHLMPLNLYNIPGTILTSRGCPFACGFCAGPVVLGRKYVTRSPENVVEEVQVCIDVFGLTSFYFIDDTMTHDTRRLLAICDGLREVKIASKYNRKLKWTCESRADVISLEILKDMRSAGCTTIQFGMESGSQELLDQLGKKVKLEQIEQAVAWSCEAGISPVLSMVFPHPNETRETLNQTFDFIRKLYKSGVEKIIPALLTLFPGTRFMDEREKLGLTLLTEDTDEYNLGTPVITTRNFSLEDIANCYSQLLLLTQQLGGKQIGGLAVSEDWKNC